MTDISLTATERKPEVNANKIRQTGKIPSVVYGKGEKPISLAIDQKEFNSLFKEAGETTLIDLKIKDGKTKKALVKDFQIDPVTGSIIHVDFVVVKMTEKTKAMIPLEFVGTSHAIKEEEGILVKNFEEIEVEALPAKLPKELKVDISSLKTFDDVITLSDIKTPEGVEFTENKPEDVLATVTPPRSEEELESLDSEVEENVEKVEGVEKDDEEDEAEATESEAAATPEKKEETSEDKSNESKE